MKTTQTSTTPDVGPLAAAASAAAGSVPSAAPRAGVLRKVLTLLSPLFAAAVIVLALVAPADSAAAWLSGLGTLALAALALVLAPRWPTLGLGLTLLSALTWVLPGAVPLTLTEWPLLHMALVLTTFLVLALLTLTAPASSGPSNPSASWRPGVRALVTGAGAVLTGLALTASATAGLQAYALRTHGAQLWAEQGMLYSDDRSGGIFPSPAETIALFGGPILVAHLLALGGALLAGWTLALVLAACAPPTSTPLTPRLQRLIDALRAPRRAIALLIGVAGVVYAALACVANATTATGAWLTVLTLLPFVVGASIAPLRPWLGAWIVASGCVLITAAALVPEWVASWKPTVMVVGALLAILIVLVCLPFGAGWWWAAGLSVVLGTALFVPFAAAASVAMSVWMDETGNTVSTTVGDGTAFGGPAVLLDAALKALPLFLLPAVLAWGLKLTASVAVERRRVAQARAELEASEKGRALQDERRGIAGDVHDVLAHSLTVIVAQGEGALVTRGAEQQDAVRRMVDVARASLRDVRALIERLDGEDTDLPSPGLENLPALLQNVRDAGLSLTSEEFGERLPLGDSTELALYRILQEALTNVLSHGGRGATARLVLDWRGEEPGLSVTLASSGGDGSGVSHGNGLGIEGMRTRAAVAGGWLTAGPDDARLGSGSPGPAAGTHLDDAPLGSGAQPAPGGPRPDDSAGAGRGWLVTAFLPAVAQSVGALR
ncbi:MAG: histidine kinase [Arthrobacter sp.]|jgi:signal transduction histidine kinase|nr:histidine kinase [Arthrobacter sp.]